MGYTPVFDTVYHGTLCGKWPTLPVWLTILPMADRNGQIDLTYQAISALTGWPTDLLRQAIAELMEPDADSRSGAQEGRRLIPLDPSRQWGWQVVNHSRYREKARKASYDSERTASGLDAARKAASRDVPRSPDASRVVPLSDCRLQTKTEDLNPKNPTAHGAAPDWLAEFKSLYPPRAGDQGWRKAERAASARLAEGHSAAEFLAGAFRYAAFILATGKANTEFVQQAATFLGPGKPFLLPWDTPAKAENAMDKIKRLNGEHHARIIDAESSSAVAEIGRDVRS